MGIRIDRGGGSANGGTGRGDLLLVGLVVTAFGLVLARQEHRPAIALVMGGSGVWIAGLHRLIRKRAPRLAVMGGLFVGWGVVGAVTAARNRFWIGALVCAALLVAGLLLLGVVPLPAWAKSAVAAVRRLGLGLATLGLGLLVITVGLGGHSSEGVPEFVPVAAGLVILLCGALVVLAESGGRDSVLSRTLVALVVTGFVSIAAVFPPSLLLLAPFAVLSWIVVVRLVIEKRTGRDPLAKWSEGHLLGLGCGVTLAIGILIMGLWQLRSCLREPEARPPAEAVGQ